MFKVLIQLADGRYHPAYYVLAPFPGGVTTPARWKSRGHHTEGFATEAEAQAHCAELAKQIAATGPPGSPLVPHVVGGQDEAGNYGIVELDAPGPHLFLAESVMV